MKSRSRRQIQWMNMVVATLRAGVFPSSLSLSHLLLPLLPPLLSSSCAPQVRFWKGILLYACFGFLRCLLRCKSCISPFFPVFFMPNWCAFLLFAPLPFRFPNFLPTLHPALCVESSSAFFVPPSQQQQQQQRRRFKALQQCRNTTTLTTSWWRTRYAYFVFFRAFKHSFPALRLCGSVCVSCRSR